MNIYIMLLRGINVGGKNIISMKSLIALLETLECKNVKTYIQSGNVVFHTDKTIFMLSQEISIAIKDTFGLEPMILLLTHKEFEKAFYSVPFAIEDLNSKGFHIGFLFSTPTDADLQKLESIKTKNEQFQLINTVYYLYAPDEMCKSKLAANSEKLLGVPMTLRSWRTVCKIRDMANSLEKAICPKIK